MEQETSCSSCADSKLLPAGGTLAIASVPMQEWEELYSPEKALCEGTAFPSLDLPFFVTCKAK